jgi:hypothetical protein
MILCHSGSCQLVQCEKLPCTVWRVSERKSLVINNDSSKTRVTVKFLTKKDRKYYLTSAFKFITFTG